MDLPQHRLCTRRTELALEVKIYVDIQRVIRPCRRTLTNEIDTKYTYAARTPKQHHTHTHTHTHTHAHARRHARTQAGTHARRHARTQARTHARTHTHTHKNTLLTSLPSIRIHRSAQTEAKFNLTSMFVPRVLATDQTQPQSTDALGERHLEGLIRGLGPRGPLAGARLVDGDRAVDDHPGVGGRSLDRLHGLFVRDVHQADAVHGQQSVAYPDAAVQVRRAIRQQRFHVDASELHARVDTALFSGGYRLGVWGDWWLAAVTKPGVVTKLDKVCAQLTNKENVWFRGAESHTTAELRWRLPDAVIKPSVVTT